MLLAILGLAAVFVLMLALSEPLPYQAAPHEETAAIPHASTTPSAQLATQSPQTPTLGPTPTATPLPEEFLANREQTIGIVIGTIVLVFIVIGGSLLGIWARRRE